MTGDILPKLLAAWAALLLFAAVSALLAAIIYGIYALVFSAGGARRLYARFDRAAEGLFGTAFGLLGIAMIARALRGT